MLFVHYFSVWPYSSWLSLCMLTALGEAVKTILWPHFAGIDVQTSNLVEDLSCYTQFLNHQQFLLVENLPCSPNYYWNNCKIIQKSEFFNFYLSFPSKKWCKFEKNTFSELIGHILHQKSKRIWYFSYFFVWPFAFLINSINPNVIWLNWPDYWPNHDQSLKFSANVQN